MTPRPSVIAERSHGRHWPLGDPTQTSRLLEEHADATTHRGSPGAVWRHEGDDGPAAHGWNRLAISFRWLTGGYRLKIAPDGQTRPRPLRASASQREPDLGLRRRAGTMGRAGVRPQDGPEPSLCLPCPRRGANRPRQDARRAWGCGTRRTGAAARRHRHGTRASGHTARVLARLRDTDEEGSLGAKLARRADPAHPVWPLTCGRMRTASR
jgi:hypothetical protein